MSNSGPNKQKQRANGTNYVASSSRVIPYSDRNFSKYLGVTRIVNKDAFAATAYNPATISRIPQAVYLGTYDKEEEAARAYDLVTLKLIGPNARLNFPLKDYHRAIAKMAQMSAEDLVGFIRRVSAASSRGKSRFRGVIKNPQTGKWQVRIVEAAGKENTFGAFDSEEEAAVAFDVASIREKGFEAITNYSLRCYNVRAIFNSEKMKQQAICASIRRQQAMHWQRANAGQIWQQAMELQAINARKVLQKERDNQAGRRFLAQGPRPEPADPLRLTLATVGAIPEKPKAHHVGIGSHRNQPEGVKEYFYSWAQQTSRRELANAPAENFKHGEFSPFCSYEEMKDTPKLFDFFAARDGGKKMPSYLKWLKAQGPGFKHDDPKHYKNDPDLKGKAQMIFYN